MSTVGVVAGERRRWEGLNPELLALIFSVLDVSHCLKITSKGLGAFGNQCKSLLHLKRNKNLSTPADDSEAEAKPLLTPCRIFSISSSILVDLVIRVFQKSSQNARHLLTLTFSSPVER
ncbi:hypothetical protein L1987_60591 [Smallanthus sonchifolius]|uniref:Uncharacterized protein n=1 Tax=Smallanthus sonchifolius TaxID=185202 RepID=A0ACB9D937_9ASTR|nr:hypothetical protein L1987_60591 [Smallanthus sonchifolius]